MTAVEVAGGCLILAALALFWWHRRRLAELREQQGAVNGTFRRRGAMPWPKDCLYCGMPAWSWGTVALHTSDTSACWAWVSHYYGLTTPEKATDKPVEYDWKAYIEPHGNQSQEHAELTPE